MEEDKGFWGRTCARQSIKIEELEAKLKRAEDNLVAIADVFVNAPTMRLEAKKCLEYINPEKYGKKYGIAPYTP